MPEYVVRERALPDEVLWRVRDEVLASPLVSTSPLAGSFRGSRGFAATFTREGRPALEQRLPSLAPFIALALDGKGARALEPWWSRWARPLREPNAFYSNLLLLADGGGVGCHVDGTLRGPSGVPDAVPLLVSVLYLRVPAAISGGELVLWRGARIVGRIAPREGMLVHFRGDLDHEVTPLVGVAPGELRASLVCEQYLLSPDALGRLAPLSVQSKAGFDAYLEDQARRARTAPFELE